jgi:hypothetical protein
MQNITKEDIGHVFSRIILDTERGCWKLPCSTTDQTYRSLTLHGKKHQAHRVFYTYFNGPIPPHNDVHHMCNTKSCIKPAHLQAIPHRLNVLLIEKNMAQRTTRLKRLLESSLGLQMYGTARFTAQQLKEILKCRQDNGNHIIKVFKAIGAMYPGQFASKRVGRVRYQQRGRPMNYFEVTMDESLRTELLQEDANHDESMAVPYHGYVDDLNNLSTALVMA